MVIILRIMVGLFLCAFMFEGANARGCGGGAALSDANLKKTQEIVLGNKEHNKVKSTQSSSQNH